MRLRSALRVCGLALAVLVLTILLGVGWLVATESGARFAVARLVALTDGALAVGSVSGQLSRGVELRELRYRDTSQQLDLEELRLRVALLQLLSGRIVVDNLSTAVISYRQLQGPPATATSSGPERFALPLPVFLSRVSIAGVTVERPDADPIEIQQIVLAGAAAGEAARVERFEFRTRGFFISLRGNVGWDESLALDGIVSWSGEVDESTVLGNATVEGFWPTFVLQQRTIEPIAQTAIGSVTLGPEPEFDLVIEQPDVGGGRLIGSYDPDTEIWRAHVEAEGLAPGAFVPDWPGRINVNGDLEAAAGTPWRVSFSEFMLEALLDDASVRAELDGSATGTETIAIERLVVTLGQNRAEISGAIDADINLDVAAELMDLAQLGQFLTRDELLRLVPELERAGELSGQALIDLAVSGTRAAPLVDGTLDLRGAQLLGLPLGLELGFASPRDGSELITLQQLDATLGGSRVTGTGSIGAGVLSAVSENRNSAPVDLELALAVESLAELAALPINGMELPEIAGAGSVRARLSGSVNRLDVDGTVELSNLAYRELSIPAAQLDGVFGLYEGAGTNVALGVTGPDWQLAMEAAGTLESGGWQGSVPTLAIDEPWLGTWQLQAPVAVSFAPDRIEVLNACLVHADSDICLDWRTGGSDERIAVAAADFDLAVLTPLLPPTVTVSGRVSLNGELDSPSAPPRGQLTLAGEGIAIDLAVSEIDRVETFLDSLTLDATLDQYALEARAAVTSSTGGEASIMMSSADVRDRDAAISGSIDVLWSDLATLAVLSPNVGEVGGTLAVSVDVTGTVANPVPGGAATLTDGHLTVPRWGVRVQEIEVEAVSDTGDTLEYTGTGFVENSEVRITGVTDIDPDAGWPTRLRLTGDYVPIAQRPDATIYASPALEATIDLPLIDVSGRILVPEARISVEGLPGQAVKVSPDSIVHGETADEPMRPIDLRADITVELGDSVRYTGSNLDTQLNGALRLRYQSGLSPDASGGLQLDGSYDAYGQELDLERGELLFAGPLDDPALDVLAVREIGATRVGVRLSGTLRAPETSMYSDPPMSELNALSYLRFGRPLTTTDGSETVTLEATALALGLQQALPAVQRVGDALGLDELSIEPTEVDAGSLMAGKYLSPKVYLSYSYGLFNRLGGFLLRYEINDRFSLETRSGNEKAMDFLYSVEKD